MRVGTGEIMAETEPNHAFAGLEQREKPRYVLLLRPAKVVTQSGEYLCILRDVATKGVRLRLFHPLPCEAHMTLELSNGDRYEVEKVWERDDQAGFNFVHQAELAHLLEERSQFRKRQVRLRLELPGHVRAGGISSPAVLHDLSQQGGRIHTALALAIDQRVHIKANGLPPLDAKVRWRRETAKGTEAGLVFEQTFRLDQLARIAAALQPFAKATDDDDDDALFSQRISA